MRCRPSIWRSVIGLAVAVFLAWSEPAVAQLRIVTYNTHEGPHLGIDTVLQAIGEETVAGVAKPIDVLLLQEQTSVSGSTQDVVDILNGIYGPGIYDRSELNGLPVFSDIRQTLVYNTQTVELLGELRVGDPGESSQARSAMRYQLRLVGYDSSAEFYAYNSHYKADEGTMDQQRRLAEATAIRTDADALGDGTHVVYAGDFNVYRSTEDAFQHLISEGAGQAFDPVNQLGSWHENDSFSQWHSQSPCSGGCPAGFTAGGMDDRFDFQLVTAELLDGEGLSYIPNTYHTFGNNGSTFNQSVTSGGNTYPFAGVTSFSDAEVRSALFTASDHLPVVADYQLPAVLEAIAGAVPPTLFQDDVFNLEITVRNAANALTAGGADELDYMLTTVGDVSGSAMGTELALSAGTTYAVTLDTSSPGMKMGSIMVTTSSQAAANSLVEIPISYEVEPSSGNTLLMQESFESAPGDGYALNTEFNDGGFDYFGRFPAPDPSNVHRDDFSGFHGDFAVYGEDHDGRGGPATVSIEFAGIDISGRSNFILSGRFGAVDDETGDFEAAQGDGIEIFVAVDGDAPMKVGGFSPDATGVSDLFYDTDLDGVGDGVALSTTLAEFTFPFTASGSLLDVIIEATSTGSQEHWALDQIRLMALSLPGDYNGDGMINAADYVVWRNHLDTDFTLANENPDAQTLGHVDQEDYDFWVAQFSEAAADGSAASVPEPNALCLFGITLLSVVGMTTRRIFP